MRQVLQKAVMGLAGSGGLSEVDLLVLPEIIHVEVAVRFAPVLVGLDCQGADKAQAGVSIGVDARDVGSGVWSPR